jgi:hypothetical protein
VGSIPPAGTIPSPSGRAHYRNPALLLQLFCHKDAADDRAEDEKRKNKTINQTDCGTMDYAVE